MKRLITQLLIFSLLLQPLGLVSPVLAEIINMQYSDPQHLHAPKVVNGVSYQYDENGNLISDEERTIEWNQDNLPVKITKGNLETRFYYDTDGTRVAKEVKDLTTGNFTNKTIYVNQYYQLSVISNQSSATKYYFANGKRIATSHQSLTTIHQPITNHLPAMLRIALQAGQQPVTNFIHHDYLGSTVLTTDTNSQPTSNSLSYFPYGNSLNNETIEQLNNLSYLFTNQELDPEVDLYNYNARLYNPKTGVFISVDTVGGGNRYAYANNNPMMFVDPSGHDAWYQDPRMSQGGLNLVDLYTLGGAQWSSYGAMMTSFPYEWYEANLPYWNGEFGTVPGTDQPYTPTSIAEQFVLGKLRPELQDQITNQVVQSVGIDAYQSAAALGGLAMVGGLKINDLHSRTSRILDLAVGEGGSYIRDVPEGTTYIGTDINIEALQVLKEKYPNALVVVADAENLPFDSASFDKIVSYWPKGTLAEQGLSGSTEGWFGEFSRVLKSEGVLEITAPSTSISVFGNGSRGLAPGYINYFELSSANQLRANDLIKINTYWSNRTLEGLISRAPSGDINPFSKVWASTFVKVP